MTLPTKSLHILWPALLLAAAPVSSAALEADFITTRGTVTVTLEHVKAPKAVASLLTLSQGTRSWFESADGSVRREPFFNGLSFGSVVNSSTVKLAEMGAPDPGYQFQDEFDASLQHEAYVLSMSNNGPNTNGALLTFTGSTALPDRNGIHTVFGKIAPGASRTVLDSILTAGAGATTITGVVIRRTDPAAVAFDEFAVALPQVQAVNGPLQVIPGSQVNLLFPQPKVSVLRATAGVDLVSWESRFHRFSALDDAPAGASVTLDTALQSKQFYQISLARYPDFPQAGGPSNFANRTLTLVGDQFNEIVYHFNATGLAGTYQNFVFPGEPAWFTGNFTVISQGGEEASPVLGPYAFQMLIENKDLGAADYNFIRVGIDAVNSGNVTGRLEYSLRPTSDEPGMEGRGSFTLTRP